MKKLSWSELLGKISKHNNEKGIKQQYEDKEPLKCVVVFKDVESWGKEFPLENKSYGFRSDNKFFLPNMSGNSIFASSLDGQDPGVRLDWYLYGENAWKIDYCYVEGE